MPGRPGARSVAPGRRAVAVAGPAAAAALLLRPGRPRAEPTPREQAAECRRSARAAEAGLAAARPPPPAQEANEYDRYAESYDGLEEGWAARASGLQRLRARGVGKVRPGVRPPRSGPNGGGVG